MVLVLLCGSMQTNIEHSNALCEQYRNSILLKFSIKSSKPSGVCSANRAHNTHEKIETFAILRACMCINIYGSEIKCWHICTYAIILR